MKKGSSAAAKQSSHFSQEKLTIGLDLGDRSSWYCVLDERGELRLENKLSTTPSSNGCNGTDSYWRYNDGIRLDSSPRHAGGH